MFEKIIEIIAIFLLSFLGFIWGEKNLLNIIIKILLLFTGIIKLFFLLKNFNII